MASFWTKLADVITPWDRGGERKRREEEALRRAQQPKVVRPTPQPNIQVQRPQRTIGGQDFSLGVEPNRQVSVPKTPTVQRQDYDKSVIDKGLDAGRSWEDISRDSGIGLDQVREYSQRTRPEYGIPKRKPNEVTLPALRDLDTIGSRGTQERRSPTKELSKAAVSTLASTGRLSAGLGQAVGTAFDYLTPGKGRNRFTEASNRKARELDVIARDHGNDALYKTMNVGGEVLMAVANPARAVGSVASKTPIISRIGAPVSRALSRLTSKADDAINIGGRTGNIIRGGTRELLDPTNVGNEVILGNKYLANELANTEQPLTPRMVAENAVMGVGGAFAPAILRNLRRGPRNTGRRVVDEAIGGTAFTNRIDDVLSEGDIEDIMRTTDIPVGRRSVDVRVPVDEGIEIPVRNLDPEGAIIRELGGDSPRVTNIPTREEIQQARFRNQNFGGADQRIEGITGPVSRQEYTTKAEIDVERQALDDALANKEINKTQHKKANKDLDDMEKSLDGRKIEVQEEKTVPVREVTDIPVDDEVGVGSVRPTKVVDRTAEKTEAAARQQAQAAPPKPVGFTEDGTPIYDRSFETSPDGTTRVKITSKQDDDIMTRLVQAVQDNRKIQKAERALNRKEKAARTKEKNRLYNEMVAQGMSRKEAEARSYAAMRGKYTDLDAGTAKFAETDAERIREMVDNSSLDDWQRANTKKAFEHLVDPERTDPLQPHERRNILRFVQDTYGKDTADLLDQAIESAGDNRSFLAKLGSFFTSSTAAADLGAPGRQGLNYWVNHPRISKQALDDSLKSAFDQKVYDDIVDTMIKDPRGSYIQEKFSGLNALTGNFDEARAKSDWASNFKGTSWYVNPSERAYNMYMTRLRWGRINDVIDKFGGVDGFEKAAQASRDPERWIKAWDKVINTGTGRGGNWNGNRGDVQVLFSARHLQSKVNRLTAPAHLKLLRDNPQAYLTQLREVGTSAGAWAIALAAAHQAGLGVEDGKIKVGNTRIDVSGGLVSLANAVRKSIDAIVNGTDGPFDRDARDIVTDYLANQLSPMLASVATLFGYDLSEGKDRYGNELTPYKVATDVAPIPIGAQGVVDDVMQGTPIWQTVMNAGLDFLGFGTNTYQTAADKDQAARAETADVVGAELTRLRDSGLLNDQMISTMSDSLQKVFAEGKTPTEKELGQIKDALVKGVGTGIGADSDTAYRERGDYEKDLAVLQLKKQILEADPTTKPSSLKDLDVQIKRSQVLLENEIPYEMFNLYQNTDLEEWRDLAETNPQLYQQLWELDELFTKAGGSYRRGDPTKQKYYVKKSGGGSGSGSRSMTAKFYGGLSNAPERRAYAQTALSKGGTDIPVIRRIRPNIVHRIGRG